VNVTVDPVDEEIKESNVSVVVPLKEYLAICHSDAV